MQAKENLPVQLIEKLKQLFQLDRPELDFGLYRIMHAKDEEITDYLENGLPATLEQALGDVSDEVVEKRRREYEEKLQEAGKYVDNPKEADEVQEAKEQLEAAKESANADEEVYDHLYRFFSRYYEKGDFVSRRYRTRETDTQAAPYAIPYKGEEVKLHWANADQYYIKTAEHFRNFRFDLREAKKMADKEEQEELDRSTEEEQLPVHFCIVEGEEGEHDNVQDADNKVRKLKPHEARPVELNEEEEVVVNFEVIFQKSQGEYIYDDEMEEHLEDKYGSGPGKSDKEPLAVAETVFDHLSEVDGLSGEYEEFLRHVPPPNRKATPPLLAQYYEQFADEYEMDYFIHKDLGGFLRRELDFYIKNEVMRLDDIDRAEAPRVERYLDKVKALRHVAHDIIDFLAQLENFQKKLWLKKKFVVDTEYCVTLDRVPDELYGEILNNDAQLEEWRDIYAIEEWGNGLSVQGYQHGSFTQEFLEAYPHLTIDTRHFGSTFTNQILAHFGEIADEGLSEVIDGICIQGENFQALNLLRERFRSKIECTYIDPPYNSPSSEILYKNKFRHSSWLSMMENRIMAGKPLLSGSGVHVTAIDQHEQERLGLLLRQIFPGWNQTCVTVVHNPSGQQGDNFSYSHDYGYFSYRDDGKYIGEEVRKNEEEIDVRYFRDVTGESSLREAGKNCFYPILVKDGEIIGFGDVCDDEFSPEGSNVKRENGVIEVYPVDPKGVERKWRFARQTVENIKDELSAVLVSGREEWDIKRTKDTFNYKTVWHKSKYSANDYGTQPLNNIIPDNPFDYPKSIDTVSDSVEASLNNSSEGWVLDFFAGSGTTAQAVTRLNRRDIERKGKIGKRRYIMVEMDEHHDTVIIPRIKKIAFAKDWEDGVPLSQEGFSHTVRYHRLESYEDTLNNLELQSDEYR